MRPGNSKRLGAKWTCATCAVIFYDLEKEQALCPRCGADARLAPPPEPPGRSKAKPRAKAKAKPKAKATATAKPKAKAAAKEA